MTEQTLRLDKIKIDGGTQCRSTVDEGVVAEYAEAYTAGLKMPPLVVFFDGVAAWLADGFHRFFAAKRIGAVSIECDVRDGTKRDAVFFASGANAGHGLRRTNEDKRRAVQVLLDDAEWAKWSDRKIAEHCGVSTPFVSAIRSPEVKERQAAARAQVVTVTTPDAHKDHDSDRGVIGLHPHSEKGHSGDVATPREQPSSLSGRSVDLHANEEALSQDQVIAQLHAELLVALEENTRMGAIFDADDRLGAATAEIDNLRAQVAQLRESLAGAMNKNNEMIRMINSLKRQLKEATK